MPIYEYRCHRCGRRFSWLEGVVAEQGRPTCPHCGEADAERLISRFAINRSQDDFGLDDEDWGEDDEDDNGFGGEFADDEEEEEE